MTLEKAFDEIDEADLQQLIENKVSERKTIDYKSALPQNNYDSKKEFLADVSSLANTTGGHLLYGIQEENGAPTSLSGVNGKDIDGEILRLENLLRDGVQPRIQNVSIRAVSTDTTNHILIIRVPQSWSKPHVVNFQGHWRFYARNSAGKYPLDVMELKSAFLATSALGDKIRNFHFDRLSKINSDETPIPFTEKARVIFHIIPYSAFETRSPLTFKAIEKDIWSLPLIYSSPSEYRYNLDGLIVYDGRQDSGAYTQIYRNGIIESVNATLFRSTDTNLYIPSIVFEEQLIKVLGACFDVHKTLLVNPPLALILSLTGVRGYKLAVAQHLDHWYRHTHTIDRDFLLLPETIVDDYAINPATTLRPIFDAVWNSSGWPRSYGYDDSGEWRKGPNFIR